MARDTHRGWNPERGSVWYAAGGICGSRPLMHCTQSMGEGSRRCWAQLQQPGFSRAVACTCTGAQTVCDRGVSMKCCLQSVGHVTSESQMRFDSSSSTSSAASMYQAPAHSHRSRAGIQAKGYSGPLCTCLGEHLVLISLSFAHVGILAARPWHSPYPCSLVGQHRFVITAAQCFFYRAKPGFWL